jgi:hypothetical protein
LLQFIKKSTVFSPELLLKVLQSRAPSTYRSSIKDLEEGSDYIRGLAFIQGIVNCDNPILSQLNKKTKLIFSSLTHQSIFSNKKGLGMDLYGNKSRAVPKFQVLDSNMWNKMKNVGNKPIQLGIKNFKKLMDLLPEVSKNNSHSNKDTPLNRDFFANMSDFGDLFQADKIKLNDLKVEDITKMGVNLAGSRIRAKVNPALELVETKTSLRSLTFLEKVMSYGIDALKLLLSLSSISKKIQGFRVGYKKIERGIRLTQFIVAFGEIFYNKKTKELEMTDPICLLKNKG